jgi:hypothetical protein
MALTAAELRQLQRLLAEASALDLQPLLNLVQRKVPLPAVVLTAQGAAELLLSLCADDQVLPTLGADDPARADTQEQRAHKFLTLAIAERREALLRRKRAEYDVLLAMAFEEQRTADKELSDHAALCQVARAVTVRDKRQALVRLLEHKLAGRSLGQFTHPDAFRQKTGQP